MSVYLIKIDPAINARRFYVVSVQDTFLGRWCVVRIHGRIGRSCRASAPVPCESKAEALALAEQVIARKKRRGYRQMTDQ